MSYTDKMLRDDALKGKVIVVTGGGSGLCKAMTKYFLELGAKVAITSRDLDKLKNTAAELETQTGGTCLPIQCDVRHYEEVENMLQEVLKAFGKVDVLLNNAAGNFISPTERLSANAFDTIIDIVLKGSKNCTLAFGKHWINTKQTNCNVLNIVTTYAWTGSGYVVPSATAKAGVLAMTRSLAVEWAKYGIRMNAIAPGFFLTEQNRTLLTNPDGSLTERGNLIIKNTPYKRFGSPEELNGALVWLLSDASKFVTGTTITVDGGFTIFGGV